VIGKGIQNLKNIVLDIDIKFYNLLKNQPQFELRDDVTQTLVLNYIPRWPLMIFLLSAMCCMGFSATYHLFYIKNKSVAYVLNVLDFAGICILTMGSFYPPIMYSFVCAQTFHLRNAFLTIVTISSTLTIIVLFMPVCNTEKFKSIRTFMFIALGGSALTPLFYIQFLHEKS